MRDLCFIPYLSGHQTLKCYGLHFTKCVNCLASIKSVTFKGGNAHINLR